jgi:hypothetical protein
MLKSTGAHAKLKETATKHMLILEQSPDRVKKYFQDPYIK